MKSNLWGMACLVGVVTTLVGCSSDSRDSTEPTASTAEAACKALYAAVRDFATRCNEAIPEDMLEQLEEEQCSMTSKAVAAGRMGFDKSKFSACVDGIKTVACNDSESLPTACAELFPGKVAAEGACYNSGECEGINAMYCAEDATCPGKCTPYRAAGQSCGETDHCAADGSCIGGTCVAAGKTGENCYDGSLRCESGLFCNTETSPTLCQPKIAQGQSCFDPYSCASGLTCLGASIESETPGTCQPPLAENASCTDYTDCALGLDCRQTSATPSAPSKCVKPKQLAESCTFGLRECSYPNSCDESTHKCIGPAAVDSSCGSGTEYIYCQDGAYCSLTTSKCAPNKAPGDSCSGWDQSCAYGCGEDNKCQESPSCEAP